MHPVSFALRVQAGFRDPGLSGPQFDLSRYPRLGASERQTRSIGSLIVDVLLHVKTSFLPGGDESDFVDKELGPADLWVFICRQGI